MPNAQEYIGADRRFIYDRGNTLDQQNAQGQWNQQQLADYYRQYGNEVYDPLIGGRGGYSQDEQGNIIRQDELQGLNYSDQEAQGAYLTPDEYNKSVGNPWERGAYFNPEAASGMQDESAGFQRHAGGQLRSDIYGAAQNPNLDVSEGYSGDVNANISGTESKVNAAVDPGKIRQDTEYASRVRMTPEQEQALVTGAGISEGVGWRAAASDLERQATSAGLDPAGTAAMKERLLRQGAGASGDAMTQARIAADQERVRREAGIESGRQQGELEAAQVGGSTQLALGNRAMTARERLEALRLGSVQDISNRGMTAATTAGAADIANERAINQQQRDVSQFNTTTGTGIATGVERDAAARNAEMAKNRQATEMYNSGRRFQTGAAINSELSNRFTGVANKRLGEAAEGRGYLAGQGQQANATATADANRRAGIYGEQTGALQGTVTNQQRADQQPKWWEKVIGAVTGAAGAASKFVGGGVPIPKVRASGGGGGYDSYGYGY